MCNTFTILPSKLFVAIYNLYIYIYYIYLQISALEQLKSCNPDGRFWLKIDGTDVKEGLMESQKRAWNGDVDLGDGKLQELRKEYYDKVERMKLLQISTIPQQSLQSICKTTIAELQEEILYLSAGFTESQVHFETKLNQSNCPESVLKDASWNVVEYQTLLQQSQKLVADFEHMLTLVSVNEVSKATRCSVESLSAQNYYKKKRTSSSHVVVSMLSDEQRSVKPYALPVRYVACTTLKDQELRMLNHDIKHEMKRLGMNLAG